MPALRRPVVLHSDVMRAFDDTNFQSLCTANPDLRLERMASGHVRLCAPAGGVVAAATAAVLEQLGHWSRCHGGRPFGSNVGFALPDGAIFAPAAAWLPAGAWERLSPAERRGYVPACPALAIECGDLARRPAALLAQAARWLRYGAALAWAVDPTAERAVVFRPDTTPQFVDDFDGELDGAPALPGFRLDLRALQGLSLGGTSNRS